jgi:hypothetical protein
MKRIVLIAGGLLALALGAAWYTLRSRERAVNSGDAALREKSADQAKLAASESASTGQPPDNTPSVAQLPTPSGDTISRNPPNGMIFAGAGKYQLYRQGDITWRLDTDTGWACVLFATDTQWAKARVFEHGCASPQTVSR